MKYKVRRVYYRFYLRLAAVVTFAIICVLEKWNANDADAKQRKLTADFMYKSEFLLPESVCDRLLEGFSAGGLYARATNKPTAIT